MRAELSRQRLTQAQLATRVGTGQSVISRKLTGRAPITIRDVDRWATALGVPISRLVPSLEHVAA